MMILKTLCTSSFLLFVQLFAFSQDYSRKPYASIHYYAEQMLKSKIVENKEEVDLRRGKPYYYAEKDLPGKYVHISGGYTGDYYMAQWKMDNGNDLVGVTHFNCEAKCVYECSFFECNLDTLKDITSEIFPVKKMEKQLSKMKKKIVAKRPDMMNDDAQYKFILPHGQGLLGVYMSIDNNRIEFPIMYLEWTGEKFVVEKKYTEVPE